jgi:predicted DNA-binding transcriptional regulator AlpA
MATSHFARASERRQALKETDPQSLLRLRQVLKLIPVSASSWWLGVRSGRFPKPLKLGPRTTVSRAADIICLIDSLTNDGGFGAADGRRAATDDR